MSLAERVAQRLHCLSCGRRYRRQDLQLVGVGNDELDLYLLCASCDTFVQLTVPESEFTGGVVTASIPRTVPTVTEEEREPVALSPVSADDVVAIRQFLSSFDGDVHRLLGARDEST